MEDVVFYTSVSAAVLGALALILVGLGWSWIAPIYREFWAKLAVGVFRAIAALSAVAARVAPPQSDKPFWEQPWAATILIAAFGYLFWEATGIVGDHKYKLAKEKTAADHTKVIDSLNETHVAALASLAQEADEATQDRIDAEFQALRLSWLLSHLQKFVGEKRQRIRRVANASGAERPSVQKAREGLNPEEQVQILLECLAALFRNHAIHEDGSRHNQNFRIGLFAEQDGGLVPLAAFDLITRSHAPFTTYATHAGRYRLDNGTNPSHAVRCVREGRTLIVADCAAEPGFFSQPLQAIYLKSMVAHPMPGFCADGVTPVSAALLIDTDHAGFFREDDREMLERLLSEFVVRLDLEYAISRLIG